MDIEAYEDAPPPLDSLEEQVQALSLQRGGTVAAAAQAALTGRQPRDSDDGDAASLPVAPMHAVTATGATRLAPAGRGAAAPLPAKPAIRKGFFDSRPSAGSSGAKARRAAPPGGSDVPLLCARPAAGGPAGASKGGGSGGASGPGAKPIPDFLMLPPDARAAARDRLVGALAPTPETLTKVVADPLLAAGFDDPEVMAAVAEVAADPSKIAKHQGNAKIMRFYAAMGQLVGSRLEQMAAGGDDGGGSGCRAATAPGGGGSSGAGPSCKQAAAMQPNPVVAGRPAGLSDPVVADKMARPQSALDIRWRD